MRTAVIILNWNGFDMLADCMRSLCAAKGDFFVVVADNGSTDGSPERFAVWMQNEGVPFRIVDEGCEEGVSCNGREVLLYRLKENYGFAKGNNKGTALALQSHPERILLLNNDTEVAPDFLLMLEDFQRRHPRYKVLTPLIFFNHDRTKIWNAGGRLKWGFRRYNYAGGTRDDIREKDFIPITFVTGCALYLPAAMADADGRVLTERFFFGEEDFDFSLRMNKTGVKMACVLSSVIYHKVGSSIKKQAQPGKLYIHYLNRFIDVRQHYGKVFYRLWSTMYRPYVVRLVRNAGCPEEKILPFVRRIYRDAMRKDGVTAEDFRTALAGGWDARSAARRRVLILSDANNAHTRRWVVATAQRGYEVMLFSFNNKGLDFYSSCENVTCRALDLLSSVKKLRTNGALEKLKYLKALPMLMRCIREFRPDILHAHYVSSYALLGALSGYHPFVVSVWGSDVYSFPNVSCVHRAILKYNLRKADRILSTSGCMARETAKYTKRDITVTPFGIDAGLFVPSSEPRLNHDFVVGTVKSLETIYGIDVLIEAFALVRKAMPHRNLRLLLVGDGKERRNLEELAMRLGIGDDVTFVGRVPNDDVPSLLARMDVYVAMSRKESFGVAALEAMACARPVVVSDAEGFVEVVPDGEVGYIVPKDDAAAAADRIKYLLEHPDTASEMGLRGRSHVLSEYTWDASVDGMMAVYEKIMNEGNNC